MVLPLKMISVCFQIVHISRWTMEPLCASISVLLSPFSSILITALFVDLNLSQRFVYRVVTLKLATSPHSLNAKILHARSSATVGLSPSFLPSLSFGSIFTSCSILHSFVLGYFLALTLQLWASAKSPNFRFVLGFPASHLQMSLQDVFVFSFFLRWYIAKFDCESIPQPILPPKHIHHILILIFFLVVVGGQNRPISVRFVCPVIPFELHPTGH